MNKAGQIFDILTETEISLISSALEKINDKPNLGQFHAYTNGFTKNDFIYPLIKKLVLDKLEQITNKKINLTHGMLLKEKFPWGIHTDFIKDDRTPDFAFLIPLHSADTHTIVFNEECVTSFDDYMKSNNKLGFNAKELYNTLCSHETIEHLEYVSLFHAFKWQIGSMIYWDRKLLHCSDNFLQNGLIEKTALVIFTNND